MQALKIRKEVGLVGTDRQEKKLRQSERVQADRDQSLHFPGATKMSSPEEARKLNKGSYQQNAENIR